MSFRARLTLFFIGIVVVPLGVSTVVVNRIAENEALQRTDSRLVGLAQGVQSAIGVLGVNAEEALTAPGSTGSPRASEAAGAAGSGSPSRRNEELDEVRLRSDLDFLVVEKSELVRAASVGRSSFFPEIIVTPERLADERENGGLVISSRVRVVGSDGTSSLVIGGYYLDQAFLSSRVSTEAMAVSRGQVVASTLGKVTLPPNAPIGEPFSVGGRLRALCTNCSLEPPLTGVVVVVTRNKASPIGDLSNPILIVIGLGAMAATFLAYLLARLLSRPLEQLTEEAIAATPAGADLRAAGPDDLAQLGAALGAIREHLQTTAAELDESRGELRRGLERLGETLMATHDLDELLEVVLEAAAATLDAEIGTVFLRSGRRSQLVAHATYGLGSPSSLRLGEGVGGTSAAEGRPVLTSEREPVEPSPNEPKKESSMAVPLSRDGGVIGAVALYGRGTGAPFNEDDLETLASFGDQMSVAIENVYQHEESERLSFTDALTGSWNRRYLELTLNEETQRGQRFGRPYSVLMLDIDRFKKVNDRYGHRRGDAVLQEMCDRISGSVRAHIDTLARFGGEEFVVVLPETPREGAVAAAEKIRQLVRTRPFEENGEAIKVTISIGVASFPSDGNQPEDLIRAADRALYEAKRAGRDRVVAHVP